MTHLTQQLFIGGTNINTDVEKFKQEGGNIIIGTPGRIEDLLMGKTDSSHRNLFVQAAKTLVSHHNGPEDLKKFMPKNSSNKMNQFRIFLNNVHSIPLFLESKNFNGSCIFGIHEFFWPRLFLNFLTHCGHVCDSNKICENI